MDGQHYTFLGFPYPQSAMDEPLFQQQAFEGNFPVTGSSIDPSLQPSPSDPYLSHWEHEPPQVKRWGVDDQRTTFFNVKPYASIITPVARTAPVRGPVPYASQIRFASPISSSDYGLTASSPLPDIETGLEKGALPTTPSDTAVLSPRFNSQHFEYNSREEALRGLDMVPPAYVKPKDVDLVSYEEDLFDSEFTFEGQTDSYGSGATQVAIEHAQAQPTVRYDERRQTDPGGTRPMRTGDDVSLEYPSPSGEHVDDDDASVIPNEQPVSKRKKSEDEDYVPGKKSKSSASSPRRTRAKPVSSKQSGHDPSTTKSTRLLTIPDTFSASSGGIFSCDHCDHRPFHESSALDSHIRKTHIQPFKCVFHFAGCTSTFPNKNEWKRHTLTQHLELYQWICTEDDCNKMVNGASLTAASASPSSRSRQQLPPSRVHPSGPGALYNNSFNTSLASTIPQHQPGVVFNRKDLYSQHVKRMHTTPDVKKSLNQYDKQQKQAKSQSRSSASASTTSKSRKGNNNKTQHTQLSPQERVYQLWKDRLKYRQEKAERLRMTLPTYMRCPARGCNAEFRGAGAWDQRMEHVARHLDSGDKGVVEFGGPGDETLTSWAETPEVGIIRSDGQGGWILLRGSGRKVGGQAAGVGLGLAMGTRRETEVDDGERDAEGEEDDGM